MQLGRQAWTEARTILTDGLTAALSGSGTTRDDVIAASHLLVSGCNASMYRSCAAPAGILRTQGTHNTSTLWV